MATPQKTTAAVIATVAASIVMTMPATATADAKFLTVVAFMVLNSLVSGALFFWAGRFNLGNLVRYIPYPVVGGFLAGSGWLLVVGALTLTTGQPLQWASLGPLVQPPLVWQWGPALGFGGVLWWVNARFQSPLIFLGAIFGAIVLVYGGLGLSGLTLAEASRQGFFLGPFPSGGLYQVFHPWMHWPKPNGPWWAATPSVCQPFG